MQIQRLLTDRSLKLCILLVSVALLMLAPHFSVYAANDLLDSRYDRLSTSVAGATATHAIGLTTSETSVPVGSISIQFCANSPLMGDPCTAITGMDITSANLVNQTGELGFSVSPSSTADTIILTRPAALPANTASEYTFGNIINPSAAGSYYGRIQTFTSTDGTGASIEEGGIVFAIVGNFTVSTEVPPILLFCTAVTITGFDCNSASSFFIDFGELSADDASRASSEFLVATNAANGFSIFISGTTLTSGNNIITQLLPGAGSSPGTSQFGVNLRSNSNPSIGAEPVGPGTGGAIGAGYGTPNVFRFQNGDAIVTSTGTSDFKKYTASYLTNVSQSQAPGFYATTLTYIALANF